MKTLFPLWIGEDADAVAAEAEARFIEAMRRTSGEFQVALSGGQTPQALYERLAETPDFTAADWGFAEFLQVDERCVPPDHPGSNYRMIDELFLSRAPIARSRIHRLRGELPPDRAAGLAESEWRDLYPPGTTWPELDFVVLGMGKDGHTASLFPGTQALEEEERWITENFVPQLDSWRVTMTFPVLARARGGVVLVTGEDKAETLMHVLDPELDIDVPIRMLLKRAPRLTLLVDRDAACGLGIKMEDLALVDDADEEDEG